MAHRAKQQATLLTCKQVLIVLKSVDEVSTELDVKITKVDQVEQLLIDANTCLNDKVKKFMLLQIPIGMHYEDNILLSPNYTTTLTEIFHRWSLNSFLCRVFLEVFKSISLKWFTNYSSLIQASSKFNLNYSEWMKSFFPDERFIKSDRILYVKVDDFNKGRREYGTMDTRFKSSSLMLIHKLENLSSYEVDADFKIFDHDRLQPLLSNDLTGNERNLNYNAILMCIKLSTEDACTRLNSIVTKLKSFSEFLHSVNTTLTIVTNDIISLSQALSFLTFTHKDLRAHFNCGSWKKQQEILLDFHGLPVHHDYKIKMSMMKNTRIEEKEEEKPETESKEFRSRLRAISRRIPVTASIKRHIENAPIVDGGVNYVQTNKSVQQISLPNSNLKKNDDSRRIPVTASIKRHIENAPIVDSGVNYVQTNKNVQQISLPNSNLKKNDDTSDKFSSNIVPNSGSVNATKKDLDETEAFPSPISKDGSIKSNEFHEYTQFESEFMSFNDKYLLSSDFLATEAVDFIYNIQDIQLIIRTEDQEAASAISSEDLPCKKAGNTVVDEDLVSKEVSQTNKIECQISNATSSSDTLGKTTTDTSDEKQNEEPMHAKNVNTESHQVENTKDVDCTEHIEECQFNRVTENQETASDIVCEDLVSEELNTTEIKDDTSNIGYNSVTKAWEEAASYVREKVDSDESVFLLMGTVLEDRFHELRSNKKEDKSLSDKKKDLVMLLVNKLQSRADDEPSETVQEKNLIASQDLPCKTADVTVVNKDLVSKEVFQTNKIECEISNATSSSDIGDEKHNEEAMHAKNVNTQSHQQVENSILVATKDFEYTEHIDECQLNRVADNQETASGIASEDLPCKKAGNIVLGEDLISKEVSQTNQIECEIPNATSSSHTLGKTTTDISDEKHNEEPMHAKNLNTQSYQQIKNFPKKEEVVDINNLYAIQRNRTEIKADASNIDPAIVDKAWKKAASCVRGKVDSDESVCGLMSKVLMDHYCENNSNDTGGKALSDEKKYLTTYVLSKLLKVGADGLLKSVPQKNPIVSKDLLCEKVKDTVNRALVSKEVLQTNKIECESSNATSSSDSHGTTATDISDEKHNEAKASKNKPANATKVEGNFRVGYTSNLTPEFLQEITELKFKPRTHCSLRKVLLKVTSDLSQIKSSHEKQKEIELNDPKDSIPTLCSKESARPASDCPRNEKIKVPNISRISEKGTYKTSDVKLQNAGTKVPKAIVTGASEGYVLNIQCTDSVPLFSRRKCKYMTERRSRSRTNEEEVAEFNEPIMAADSSTGKSEINKEDIKEENEPHCSHVEETDDSIFTCKNRTSQVVGRLNCFLESAVELERILKTVNKM